MSHTFVSTWEALYGPSFVSAAPARLLGDDTGPGHRRDEEADARANTGAHDHSVRVAPSRIGGRAVAELVDALRADDQAALEIVYVELFGLLWSVAYAYTRSPDGAKDLVQDVFLWLWTRREILPLDTDLRVYLAAAVRNRARNLRRHESVVDATVAAVISEVATPPAVGTPEAADASVESHEFYDAYRTALSLLSERERVAALLRWEEDFTLDQIGEVLSVSAEGARKILVRAQDKVRKGLAAYRT